MQIKVVVTLDAKSYEGEEIDRSVGTSEALRAIQEAVIHTYRERGFFTINPIDLRVVDVEVE